MTALAAVTLLALPAIAATNEEPVEEAPPATFAPGEAPAVEVDLFEEEEQQAPQWTYNFLVPTTIALAVVVVLVTVIQYFVRVVRPRYEVQ